MTGLVLAMVLCQAAGEEAPHPVTEIVRQSLETNGRSADGTFTLIVRIDTDEPQAIIDAVNACSPPTRKEDGNIRYQLHQSADEPDTFILYERWQSLGELDAHLKAEHTRRLLEVLDAKASIELKVMRPIVAPGE